VTVASYLTENVNINCDSVLRGHEEPVGAVREPIEDVRESTEAVRVQVEIAV
jgi:hypothetical protein